VPAGLLPFKLGETSAPLLRTPELHAAMHCLQMCGHWADTCHIEKLQLIFDKNEPFYGHIHDRWHSKRAKKEEPTWAHVLALSEADSQELPALQAADVIAWAVGQRHEKGIMHDWQGRIVGFVKEAQLYDYKKLKNPDMEALESLDRWRIPRRKPYV
jgi:hypothetical protein